MKTTKRILVLLCLMVVTMGAWADPAWKIKGKHTSDWVDMTIQDAPTGYDGQAIYTTETLAPGSYTYYVRYYADGCTDIDSYTAQITNGGLSFTLSEAATVFILCKHPNTGVNWLNCISNVNTYQVVHSNWEILSTCYPSPGNAATVNYFNFPTGFNVGGQILEGAALNAISNTHVAVHGVDKRVKGPITLTNNSTVGVNKATLNYETATMTYESVTTLPVTITSAGASTLVLPAQAAIPAGVKAYTLKYENSVLKAAELTSYIPANTPVLLNGEPDTYDFVMSGDVSYNTTNESLSDKTKYYIKDVNRDGNFTDENNVLVGVMQPHYVPTNSYVLQDGENGLGFYNVGENANYRINQFRCYITLPEPAAHSLSIVFDDSETTGIADVRGQKEDVRGDIFNLSGQRVGKDYKGVVIKNGRKMIQK